MRLRLAKKVIQQIERGDYRNWRLYWSAMDRADKYAKKWSKIPSRQRIRVGDEPSLPWRKS